MSKDKSLAVQLVSNKINKLTYLSYEEISEITGYHPKYLLKLRKEILDGNISLVHGNKHKRPHNAMNEEEKQKIINLYKRSNASIRAFCRFYGKRSYSCIYNIIHEYEDNNISSRV